MCRSLYNNPLALGFLDAAEAAELQALCDLNPQAAGHARELCDALGGGSDPCGIPCDHYGSRCIVYVVTCSADGHLTEL